MRVVDTAQIEETVYEMCRRANTRVNDLLLEKLEEMEKEENNEIAKETFSVFFDNFKIAREKGLPICQDTGMAIVFLEIGQEVFLSGDYVEEAVNKGVERAYADFYFRKSVVKDPLDRVNTKTNTPAVIHTRIVEGDSVEITLTTKGFGSENTSALKMLKPADGLEGVKSFILDTIVKAIPNGCAPLIVGVGIGGDFESSALNAKRALTLPIGSENKKEVYKNLEVELKDLANETGIGPMGTGGKSSVLDVHVIEAPTHIAGLPVAVNICCYVDRVERERI